MKFYTGFTTVHCGNQKVTFSLRHWQEIIIKIASFNVLFLLPLHTSNYLGSLPQVLLSEGKISSSEKSVQILRWPVQISSCFYSQLHFWKELLLLRIRNNLTLLLDTIWVLKHNCQIVACHSRCTRGLCTYASSYTPKKLRSLLSAVSYTPQISRMLKMTFMLKQADSLTHLYVLLVESHRG